MHHFLRIVVPALALFLSSCAKQETAKVLRVYNWSEYFAESVIPRFEKEFGCKVVLDTFDSNEQLYATLKEGKERYDVIFPSSYQAYTMRKEGMIRPLDSTKLPNLRYVDTKYLARNAIDKNLSYSVPYMTGSTAIGYRKSVLGDDVQASWSLFDRPEVKGRCCMLDDKRETIGAALKFLGYSANTTNASEIEAAAEVVKRWKRNVAKFDNEAYKPGLASGEFVLVHGYSGDIKQVVNEDESGDIVFALPKEGFMIWADDMAIPSDAENVGLAEDFINFLYRPDIAALNMNHTAYVAPNTAAYELVDPALKADETVFIPDDLLAKAETIFPLGNEAKELYAKAWDEIQAN